MEMCKPRIESDSQMELHMVFIMLRGHAILRFKAFGHGGIIMGIKMCNWSHNAPQLWYYLHPIFNWIVYVFVRDV